MTRRRYLNAKCHECNVDAICPKCNKPVSAATPFSDWLRELGEPLTSKNVVAHNLDYIWFHYRERWFITIEEKRFGGRPTKSQEATHDMITQLLCTASGSAIINAYNGHSETIEYRGHYCISFEKTTPDDSECVTINGTRYDEPHRAIRYLLRHGSFDGPNAPKS